MLERLLIVVGIVVAAAAVGWWWQRAGGAVRTTGGDRGPAFDPARLGGLGLDPGGAEALGVLLSSPGCAPCRSVERILAELADQRDAFRWTSLDAADHLELAERHHVMRVPTLFVLAPDGRILARTSGVPARRELAEVLDRERSGVG